MVTTATTVFSGLELIAGIWRNTVGSKIILIWWYPTVNVSAAYH